MANKEIDRTAESLSNLSLTPAPPLDPSPIKVMYKGSRVPLSWMEAAEKIAYDSCTCPPPVVFICGPGNTGKSAFGRVLLDTLFQRYQRVGYLETDVGQPEFTTPGCVSLHIIEEPTPDLTVLCMKTPQKCLFFGDFCPNINTEDYLSYTANLYNYFLNKFYKLGEADECHEFYVPLIVNTSGWITGSGFDLLVDMVRFMNPTHVVKVRHPKASKNLPDGTFWLTGGEKSSAEIINICSIHNYTSMTASRNDACRMRELRFVAYFRQCLRKDLDIQSFPELISKLSDLRPLEISLSKINITYLHCQDLARMTCCSLMGMIVGLAISSPESSSTSVSIPTCVGLGIVRFIDVQRGIIYLIAPVHPLIVEKVDVLLRGTIKVPPSLVLGTEMVEFLPDRMKQLMEEN